MPGTGDKVGVVPVTGVIDDPAPTLKALREFRLDASIKAVVVRIDSPGGAVGASQEIYEEIRRLDAVKPVVASMGSVAASGGYYAALGARKIIANPGTVTGSIGVILKIPNLGRLLQKLGIRTTVVKSGKLKDLGSVTRDLTPAERRVLQGVMSDIHRQFIEAVARSRGLEVTAVEPLADGRILSGRQARDAGLLDELGNFSLAVQRAAELARIEGEPTLVYPRKDRMTLLRELLEEEGAEGLARLAGRLADSLRPRLTLEPAH
nr:signal peptide peptidase SppA [Dissulfurirhabdus thermomarina]